MSSPMKHKHELHELRRMLKEDFGQFLSGRGFKYGGLYNMCYIFRRVIRSDAHIIEVQLDQYNRPNYIVNFGRFASDGIVDAYGRSLLPEKVRVWHLPERGRLYPRRMSPFYIFGPPWFGLPLIRLRPLSEILQFEFLRLTVLFDQVEEWLCGKPPGPNLRIFYEKGKEANSAKQAMIDRGRWPPKDWTDADEAASKSRPDESR